MRQQAIQNQFAANENDKLKALLAFRDGPRFPSDYTGLAAAVIARPTGGFAQDVVVAVGSNDGVALDAPVVTEDGFLGRVTRVYSRSARVTLLTDEQLAVSALDVKIGRRRHRQARACLRLDAHLRPRPEEAQGLGRRHHRHRRLALEQARIALSPRDPDRAGDERRARPTPTCGSRCRSSRSPTSTASTRSSCSSARTRSRERGDGVEDRADRVLRRDHAGVGVLDDLDRRRRAGRAARHPRFDRAASRVDHRSRRRLPRRAHRRRDHARNARPHLAAADAGRLLGRTLRRDDRPRPPACAARRDGRRDRVRRGRRLRARLAARRRRRRAVGAPRGSLRQ